VHGQRSAPSGSFKAISAGGSDTCGIRTDDTISCWGGKLYGQLVAPSGAFKAISAGNGYACAIRTDDAVACWGNDYYRQAQPPSGHFKAISAGSYHACAIRTDDAVACWGYRSGTGEPNAPPSGTFKAIGAGGSLGASHTCAIRTDDTLDCWGYNNVGQLSKPSGTFKALTAGSFHTCAIRTDDTVGCWGDNSDGQSTPPSTQPPRWLLQTVDCWGKVSCGSEPPPGGKAFLRKVEEMVAIAKKSVDIADLIHFEPGVFGVPDYPDGPYLDAIVDGLKRGHREHPNEIPLVRLLVGVYPISPSNPSGFMRELVGRVGDWVKVQSGVMRTTLTSFNHAKVLDVDGREAIVGGMNYWASDYLNTAAPTNDVSMSVKGPAAADVSRYMDVLWGFTCDNRFIPFNGVDVAFHPGGVFADCVKNIPTEPARPDPNGRTIMVVGKLGHGIAVPGEPYGKESAPIDRPALSGNTCNATQEREDNKDVNNKRDYEYRNPGETALRALIESARSSIFISQQDLLSCIPKPAIATEAKFNERLFAALAQKITAGIPIKIVLSSYGTKPGGYSNGYHVADVADMFTQMLEKNQHLSAADARQMLCNDVGLAEIRNDPNALTWQNGTSFYNHAKLVAVDDQAFYIGSDNLYPSALQELGLIVDDRPAAAQLKQAYLDPLWNNSRKGALIDPQANRCSMVIR
jgi:phosphatidylserine/phosphatidylglycerophosphate/cardiolipin synthase-like enzyme